MEADQGGRPPFPASKPEGYEELVRLNEELPPVIEPIIKGGDIINSSPISLTGPEIGSAKKAAFEAQLDEKFTTREDALQWLKLYLVSLYGQS